MRALRIAILGLLQQVASLDRMNKLCLYKMVEDGLTDLEREGPASGSRLVRSGRLFSGCLLKQSSASAPRRKRRSAPVHSRTGETAAAVRLGRRSPSPNRTPESCERTEPRGGRRSI